MKRNATSRVTLRPKEFELVLELKAKPGVQSNVEVVRRGLVLLQETTDRENLREAYRRGSLVTKGARARVPRGRE